MSELLREHLLKHWIEAAPKRPRSSHAIFPEPRLAFMNAQRQGFSKRRAVPFRVQSLIIKPMASLMNATEKAGRQFVFVDPRRHPHVGRMKGCGERVSGKVE